MKVWNRIILALRDRLRIRREIQNRCLQVTNLTRGTVLATRMEVADNSAKRNKGLLGRERLEEGEGLWIVPCQSVHTFWMKFPIDLVYLNRKGRVKKLRAAAPAWRLSICLSAHSVIELPAGVIRDTRTQRGDQLEFSLDASIKNECLPARTLESS